MARTSEGAALTARHHQQQVALRAAFLRDLLRLWPLWTVGEVASYGDFLTLAAVLIRERHRESAGIAAAYFDAFRAAEGIGGVAPLRLADPPSVVEIAAALRATGLAGTMRALRNGYTPEAASRSGFVQAAGSASRLMLAGGRDTILAAVGRDARALGWQRITDARPCAFCAMIAARGPRYKTGQSADFKPHDHDQCQPEPLYRGSKTPQRNKDFARLWKDATAGKSGAEARNAFRKALEGRE